MLVLAKCRAPIQLRDCEAFSIGLCIEKSFVDSLTTLFDLKKNVET